MSVPDRNHLAIGEVLSLLQAEFPDVTISKIRFLESQGLIDPERTPSGYRKFYDDDIARLRWILAQQRDHFLPLKVIKDRLEEAVARQLPLDVAPGPGSSEAEPELVAEVPLVASAGARNDALANGGRGPRINVFTATATSRPDVAADAGAVTVGQDEPLAEAPVGSEGSSDRTAAGSAGADGDRPVGDPSDGSGAVVTSGVDAPHADLLHADHRPAAAADGMTAPDAGDSPEPAVRVDSGAAAAAHDPAPSAAPGRVRRRAPAGAHPFGDLTSASFTIEELSAAVGLPVSDLEELERYGLLTSRAVSQGRRYGDDAVVVAKLAQRFAAFGVQARHLRMFKVAVDREIALYEQIVAPLARHRHEGGEVAAAQRWADLDQLGADLRDALFRRPLS